MNVWKTFNIEFEYGLLYVDWGWAGVEKYLFI